MMRTVLDGEVDAIVFAYHGAPLDVLGPHVKELADGRSVVAIRAFRPLDAEVFVVARHDPAQRTAMQMINEIGFFEAVFEDTDQIFPYTLHLVGRDASEVDIEDPYAYPLQLTDFDLYLLGEGTHFRTYEKLGAHLREVDGVQGVHFAVWAPNAERVSVKGNFNQWDGRAHPLQLRPQVGVWELFIPGLVEGEVYKYEIKSRYMGYMADKSDPYGVYAELRPKTGSIVFDLEHYSWGDSDWIANRKQHNGLNAPMAIYEVHLGSWKRVPDTNGYLNYRDLADELAEYAKKLGYTHIELLPVGEYPFDGSWGYQVIGYFAPTSRFGTPTDFMYFVDRLHQSGIGVILDWVPAHFPSDAHGLGFFDGTHLYEHEDPRRGEHAQWGTKIFNFGRNEVRNFLISSALYWLEKYHIDGLRVDAVASMLYLDYGREGGDWVRTQYGGRENLDAVDFIRRFNEQVHKEFPDVLTMAEESTSWPLVTRPGYVGGLGFDLKWNMGWMHDMLDYMGMDSIFRRFHHNSITFSLMYAFTENFILPFSHDEVVHLKKAMITKMPGDDWQKFAGLRALYGYMYTHPGKKLLFMGGEFGQWHEWDHDRSLDWHLTEYDFHKQLQQFVTDLNHLYQAEPALYQVDFSWEGFDWINFRDVDKSIIAFERRGVDPNQRLVVICNFTPVPRSGYRVGVPLAGFYTEILNSDAAAYGGGNLGNNGGLPSDPIPWDKRPHSILVTLPPLGVVIFKTPLPESTDA